MPEYDPAPTRASENSESPAAGTAAVHRLPAALRAPCTAKLKLARDLTNAHPVPMSPTYPAVFVHRQHP